MIARVGTIGGGLPVMLTSSFCFVFQTSSKSCQAIVDVVVVVIDVVVVVVVIVVMLFLFSSPASPKPALSLFTSPAIFLPLCLPLTS